MFFFVFDHFLLKPLIQTFPKIARTSSTQKTDCAAGNPNNEIETLIIEAKPFLVFDLFLLR